MRFTLKRLLSTLLIFTIVMVIVVYAYYQSYAIMEGPHIALETPLQGMTSTTSLMLIKGVVRHAKEIVLQGRPIFIDTEGNFSEKLLLMEGYNIIELTARDAQGREDKQQIEVVYKPELLDITF